MGALLRPDNRMKEGIKWGLLAHTAAMFSLVTVHSDGPRYRVHFLHRQPGIPWCRRHATSWTSRIPVPHYAKAVSIALKVTFLLNNWLTDGLFGEHCDKAVIWVSNVVCPFSCIVAS